MRAKRNDRRVQKTRDLLHGALSSLIHEKPYDGIVVKEILARANVGRSTFYTHYRDKDDLLDDAIRDTLAATKVVTSKRRGCLADEVLSFSLPILEHIERHRIAGAQADAPRHAALHDRLGPQIVRHVADELRQSRKHVGDQAPDVSNDLLARFVASSFLVALNWWIESEPSLSASDVNKSVRALLLPTLTRA